MIGKLALRDRATTWVDRAIDVQDGALRAYVAQVRAGLGPADGAAADIDRQVGVALENQYLATVSGSGAAVGGAASVPGVGTTLAVGLSVAETVAFLDATALFTLATAEIAGCRVSDLSRRRALLLLVLLGDDAVRLVSTPSVGAGGTDGGGWGRRLVALPDEAVEDINRTAEKWLVTRFGARQGMYVLGRLAPFGIGAAVGAAGNALTAKGVIARVRNAFATPCVDSPVAVAPEAPVAHIEPPKGKYAGLHTLLASRRGGVVTLKLADVDSAVAGGLPAAARQNPAWWSNESTQRSPQARAWLAAGLQVSDVDLAAGTIRLRRARRAAASAAAP